MHHLQSMFDLINQTINIIHCYISSKDKHTNCNTISFAHIRHNLVMLPVIAIKQSWDSKARGSPTDISGRVKVDPLPSESRELSNLTGCQGRVILDL